MSRKAEDAGGLTPAKDDNAARRKIDCKDNPIFKLVDYIYKHHAERMDVRH